MGADGTRWGLVNRSGDGAIPFHWDSAIAYRVGTHGPIYRLLIRQIRRDRAEVVWLDPELNTIWERELDIQVEEMAKHLPQLIAQVSFVKSMNMKSGFPLRDRPHARHRMAPAGPWIRVLALPANETVSWRLDSERRWSQCARLLLRWGFARSR